MMRRKERIEMILITRFQWGFYKPCKLRRIEHYFNDTFGHLMKSRVVCLVEDVIRQAKGEAKPFLFIGQLYLKRILQSET
jgi:hypothetical protein